MSKHIIVVCTEFKSYRGGSGGTDINSRMYDEDMKPIMSTYSNSTDQYHLGQISSSFLWAVQDCAFERYSKDLNEIFPDANNEFIFEYVKIPLNK